MKISVLVLGMCATLLASTERIYVANSGGDDITVIDPATNAVTGTIKVSDHRTASWPRRTRHASTSRARARMSWTWWISRRSRSCVACRWAAGRITWRSRPMAGGFMSASGGSRGSTSSTPPRSRWSRGAGGEGTAQRLLHARRAVDDRDFDGRRQAHRHRHQDRDARVRDPPARAAAPPGHRSRDALASMFSCPTCTGSSSWTSPRARSWTRSCYPTARRVPSR